MPRRRRRSEPVPDPMQALTRIPERVAQPQEGFSQTDAAELRAMIAEQHRRMSEALRLYQPLPNAEEFHRNKKRIRLLIGSNRAGKTLAASVEFARAVTGQDPFGKFPRENGKAFVFALTGKQLGDPIYEKLFRAGAFMMIRDENTGLWRAYHGVNDRHREHEAKKAPPLIPRRFIANISWERKREHIPRMITLVNGWEIYFFSSLAEIPQGQAIDLWWIDEEPGREQIIAELRPRCVDRRGKGFWSATPQVASNQLFELHDRAGDEDTFEQHLHIVDNPHIPPEEKDALFRGLDEEQRKVRWEGQFLFSSFLVYPMFSKVVHAWPEDQGWQVPVDWARYISVDPGTQRCSVLFLAVPPPHVGRFVVIYDECYIEKCDAEIFGRQVGMKSVGVVYEAGLIDGHAGRVDDMGSGRNIQVQYEEALKKYGVQFRNGGSLTWGCDDVDAGIGAVKEWLRIQRETSKPKLLVVLCRCPNLVREFERYRWAQDPTTRLPTDRPIKKNDHAMDNVRYLAMYDPKWRRPKSTSKKAEPAYEAFLRKKNKLAAKTGRTGISLGMGSQE